MSGLGEVLAVLMNSCIRPCLSIDLRHADWDPVSKTLATFAEKLAPVGPDQKWHRTGQERNGCAINFEYNQPGIAETPICTGVQHPSRGELQSDRIFRPVRNTERPWRLRSRRNESSEMALLDGLVAYNWRLRRRIGHMEELAWAGCAVGDFFSSPFKSE